MVDEVRSASPNGSAPPRAQGSGRAMPIPARAADRAAMPCDHDEPLAAAVVAATAAAVPPDVLPVAGSASSDAPAPADQVVLLDGIWKSYGGIPVLKGVTVDLREGEIHALLGGNGAGKSTLMKILTGVAAADAGRIVLGGTEAGRLTPRTAHAHGVYLVPQEPELFANLSVLENIRLCLGSEKVSSARIREVVDNLSGTIDITARASDLSISEQQLVEIARGLLIGAKVLIVDEPTSALTAREADRLFEVLRGLVAQGVGIFYVSHRMSEIMALCGRVTVLRDGAVALQSATKDNTVEALVAAMVPDQVVHQVRDRADRHVPAADSRPSLVVEHLSGNGFSDVSLEVHPGEVLGIAGVVGSGRTELAETIYGLRRGMGTVRLNGTDYARRSPRASLRHGLAYVPEDRHEHGVFLVGSIVDNVTSTVLDKVSSGGILSPRKERELTDRITEDLALQEGARGRLVQNLSGGNQQKISLAKALAANPSVIVLDEPSRGIDVAARGDLYQLIEKLADDGLAVLIISSDFEEVALLSSRVLIMRDGRITEELHGDDITLERVRNASFGALSTPGAAA